MDDFYKEMNQFFKTFFLVILFAMVGFVLIGRWIGTDRSAIIYTVEHKGVTYEADNLYHGSKSSVVHFRDRATGKEMSIEGDYIVKQK